MRPRLEQRYIVNAALLPKLRPRSASFAKTAPMTSSTSESLMEQPIMIHGRSVPEFQRIYHSVVDRKLLDASGKPCCYTLELGCRLKQRLWKRFKCPSLIGEQQILYTQTYSRPTMKSSIPCFKLETSQEPESDQPN